MKAKKHLLLSALFLGLALTASAQDASTHPDRYFLTESQVANSRQLLPPPPLPGSAQFKYDEAQYQWGKMQRHTARGKQAIEDANLSGNGVSRAFSEAFGVTISKEQTPEIYKLLMRLKHDAGDLSVRVAKNYYMRMRPFILYGEHCATPEEEDNLRKNGSYPSGHTCTGWSIALVLAEINLDRQDQILQRGYEFGQSRVIIGVHWQSDVDAGRVVASTLVARLHALKDFTDQLDKAKKEFAKLQKAGKVKAAGE